jgi:hypothetical protein
MPSSESLPPHVFRVRECPAVLFLITPGTHYTAPISLGYLSSGWGFLWSLLLYPLERRAALARLVCLACPRACRAPTCVAWSTGQRWAGQSRA